MSDGRYSGCKAGEIDACGKENLGEKLRILACLCVYNELDILPYLLRYFGSQGIEVFIFDNFSNDGTWEYLKDNRYNCSRFDTGGKFCLKENIRRKVEKWHSEKPDWCIYSDADEFPLTTDFKTLSQFIENRSKKGFNVIRQRIAYFYPTGKENFGLQDPRKIFNYYKMKIPRERIFKFGPKVGLTPAAHSVCRMGRVVSDESLKQPIFHYTLRQNWKRLVEQRVKRLRGEFRGAMHVHYKRYAKRGGRVWNTKGLKDLSNPKNELHTFYRGG